MDRWEMQANITWYSINYTDVLFDIVGPPQFLEESEANDSKFNAGVQTLEIIQVFGMPKAGAKTLCTYGMSYLFLVF